MQFVKAHLAAWIQAAIILVVGILCIVAGAVTGSSNPFDAKDALDAISMVLGITLIIIGSLAVILAILTGVLAKTGFAAIATPGAALLAIGISLVVAKYAATMIGLLITVVPYLMLCLGGIVLLDAIFNFIMGIKAKEMMKALPSFIVGCLIAVAAIVLGALCVGSDPVIQYGVQLIVFGIIVCLVACFKFLVTFVKLPDAMVVVTKKTQEN